MTNLLLLIFGLIYWKMSHRVYGPWNQDLSLVHIENLETLKNRAWFTAWTAGLTAVAARVGLVLVVGI
jgi:hypothetical protein